MFIINKIQISILYMNKIVEDDYIKFFIKNNKIEFVFCNRTLGAKKLGCSPTLINMYMSNKVKSIMNGDIIFVSINDIDKIMYYLDKFKNKEYIEV